MKTIGLIGGMSWESSSEYYRIINESIKSKLGGLHSAKMAERPKERNWYHSPMTQKSPEMVWTPG